MKKNYTAPEMQVLAFEAEDIVTASNYDDVTGEVEGNYKNDDWKNWLTQN